MKIFLSLAVLCFSLQTSAQESVVIKPNAATDKEKVEVKKKKDGANVYNFNFYHDKENKEGAKAPEAKPAEQKPAEEKVVPIPPKQPTRKGSGFEGGLFTVSYLGSMPKVSDLNIGIGLRAGFALMSQHGSYLTPSLLIVGADAKYDGLGDAFMVRDYDGTAMGASLKLGKIFDGRGSFMWDAGVELAYLTGDLEADSIFGSGTYEFKSASASVYGGPVFAVGDFLVSGLVGLGAAHLNVVEKADDDTESFADNTSKVMPMLSLSINAVYVF
jgi:opacity protein-like surface antigen